MASKVDYEAIADEFREVREQLKKNQEVAAHVAVLWLENRLCEYFHKDNSRFSREAFRAASRPSGWSIYA